MEVGSNMDLNLKTVFVAFRFWVHLVMSYIFSCWTYYVLYQEYKTIASMRLQYLAYQNRHPDQFTVRLLTLTWLGLFPQCCIYMVGEVWI